MADVKLREIAEEPKYLQKPKNYSNHNNAVEDSLDLPLHGDKAVDKPHHDANYDKRKNQSYKGHLLFSNRGIEADWFSFIKCDAVSLDRVFLCPEGCVSGIRPAKRIGVGWAGLAQES
jgi:hypothetical protein